MVGLFFPGWWLAIWYQMETEYAEAVERAENEGMPARSEPATQQVVSAPSAAAP